MKNFTFPATTCRKINTITFNSNNWKLSEILQLHTRMYTHVVIPGCWSPRPRLNVKWFVFKQVLHLRLSYRRRSGALYALPPWCNKHCRFNGSRHVVTFQRFIDICRKRTYLTFILFITVNWITMLMYRHSNNSSINLCGFLTPRSPATYKLIRS